MARFRKKPVVIEAVRFPSPELPGIVNHGAKTSHPHCPHQGRRHLHITTLEGDMVALEGDWVITGVKGERYPCKPDVFEATYEPVEG